MFEKEAEESFMCKKVLYKWETDKRSYIDGFKDGYNKANEFHYCKDGLPEKEKSVLIYTEIKNVYMAKLVKDDYFITKEGGYVQTTAVIAWKEIVLPEIKESE